MLTELRNSRGQPLSRERQASSERRNGYAHPAPSNRRVGDDDSQANSAIPRLRPRASEEPLQGPEFSTLPKMMAVSARQNGKKIQARGPRRSLKTEDGNASSPHCGDRLKSAHIELHIARLNMFLAACDTIDVFSTEWTQVDREREVMLQLTENCRFEINLLKNRITPTRRTQQETKTLYETMQASFMESLSHSGSLTPASSRSDCSSACTARLDDTGHALLDSRPISRRQEAREDDYGLENHEHREIETLCRDSALGMRQKRVHFDAEAMSKPQDGPQWSFRSGTTRCARLGQIEEEQARLAIEARLGEIGGIESLATRMRVMARGPEVVNTKCSGIKHKAEGNVKIQRSASNNSARIERNPMSEDRHRNEEASHLEPALITKKGFRTEVEPRAKTTSGTKDSLRTRVKSGQQGTARAQAKITPENHEPLANDREKHPRFLNGAVIQHEIDLPWPVLKGRADLYEEGIRRFSGTRAATSRNRRNPSQDDYSLWQTKEDKADSKRGPLNNESKILTANVSLSHHRPPGQGKTSCRVESRYHPLWHDARALARLEGLDGRTRESDIQAVVEADFRRWKRKRTALVKRLAEREVRISEAMAREEEEHPTARVKKHTSYCASHRQVRRMPWWQMLDKLRQMYLEANGPLESGISSRLRHR